MLLADSLLATIQHVICGHFGTLLEMYIAVVIGFILLIVVYPSPRQDIFKMTKITFGFVFFFLAWFAFTECEVTYVMNAFESGYQAQRKHPDCFVNRSEVTRDFINVFEMAPIGGYFLVEGPHRCGKTTILISTVKEIGPGVQYVSVGSENDIYEGLVSAFSLKSCKKAGFLHHLAKVLGVSTPCPEKVLERVKSILSVLKRAVYEISLQPKWYHHPILVLDNVAHLMHIESSEGEEILRVLQDFAKTVADEKLLTIIFASSEGTVPKLFTSRSSKSRLTSLFVNDISDGDAIKYLKCRLPAFSNETIIKTVELLGGRFALLNYAIIHHLAGSSMEELQISLFMEVERELGSIIQRRFDGTNPVIKTIMSIARNILHSKEKQITENEFNKLLQPLYNEGLHESINRLVSSNVFLIRHLYVKFQSKMIEQYFKTLVRNNEE